MAAGAVPGEAARNGLPAAMPYLSPNQRAMLAALANHDRLALRDLASLLGRLRHDAAVTVGSLHSVGMVHVETCGRVTWVKISDRGRDVVTCLGRR